MNLLNENQAQQLEEISKNLQKIRQEQGIRIEEVALKTNIRLYFLQALEAGRFAELPEPVYIQGFIRRYADVLGLDGQTLAKSFKITAEPVVKSPIAKEAEKPEKKSSIRIPLFIPYVLLLGVAAVGLVYILNPKLITESIFKKPNPAIANSPQTNSTQLQVAPVESKPETANILSSPSNNAPVDSQPETTNIASSPTIATSPPTQSPTALATPTPEVKATPNSTVAVTLELQGKSWLQVKADGKVEFVGELTKGEKRTWEAKKQLTVRSGNAGAVLVSINQQPAQPLGNNGVVREVTYTPESTLNNQ